MSIAGIKVLTVGRPIELPYEVLHVEKASGLLNAIAKFRPDVIVSLGKVPGALMGQGLELRKNWLHWDVPPTPGDAIQGIERCYFTRLWRPHERESESPLVSVYTATHDTGAFLRETYQSLKEQTYPNWEWVVLDDGSTDGTWERLLALADEDVRVRPFQSRHSGKIGEVKDAVTKLCRGVYLVELDHDDMLTDSALTEIRAAFDANPAVGMVYSNWAGFFQDGSQHRYEGADWGFRYRETEYRGKKYAECRTPDIYDRFSPHFMHQFGWYLRFGPNHVRAFRASTFRELGGYNPRLPVADDWDLFARFFLRSTCLRIDRLLYLYRFVDLSQNTTDVRNQMIQDHLALGQMRYQEEFAAFDKKRLASRPELPESPLISIVTPTYSRPELLLKAVRSAAAQDYPNIEIVVVGDGCPDLDAEAVREAAGARACTVENLEKNHGAGGAVPRNRGLSLAAGEYVAYLDDDNEFAPDHVSSVYAAMREMRATFGFSSMLVDGKDLKFNAPRFQGIDGGCVVHKKSLIDKYGPWKDRAAGGYAHDWEIIKRWLEGGETWNCTLKPTLIYNGATSGQGGFLASRGETPAPELLEVK